jgi:hypothetical protein
MKAEIRLWIKVAWIRRSVFQLELSSSGRKIFRAVYPEPVKKSPSVF